MSSRFWTFLSNLTPGQVARAESIDAKLNEIDAAFEVVAEENNRVVRFSSGGVPASTDFIVADTAAQRAGKVLGFNAGGLPTMMSVIWAYRGAWLPTTPYAQNDVIALGSPASGLWVCTVSHTSSAAFATDQTTKWIQVLDLTEVNRAVRRQQIIGSAQSPFQATAGDDLLVDVTAGAVTIRLPATPTLNDQAISITHLDGPIGANPITVARNAQLIMGLAEDMLVNDTNAAFEIAFSDAARGWRLVRGT